MKNKTHIIAEKGSQEVKIIREFEAPREMVFRAFSDPEILVQFFGPDRLTMKLDYFDFKSRGAYRYSHSDDKGNVICSFNGVIHEVKAPEMIVQTAEMEGMPEPGHVVLETIRFEALPNDRTRVTFHDVCMFVADCEMMIASGMEVGLEQGFSRLDGILENGI